MPASLAVALVVVAAWLLGWRWWSVLRDNHTTTSDGGLNGWLARLFAQLLLGLSLIGLPALLLAELGFYRPWLLLLILLLLAVIPIFFRRPQNHADWPNWSQLSSSDRAQAGLLLLWLLGAGWLFFRPHESLMGAADAGVYLSLGANIHQSGGILIEDETIAGLSPALYPLLLRQLPAQESAPYYHFPGFYAPSPASGDVVPQFYPLHPVWLAIFYGLGNVPAMLLATGLWGLLAGLAVYFLVSDWLGWRWGLLALAGMTANGLHIWFNRYPTTEPLTQLLLWGGLWALFRWQRDREHPHAWGLLAELLLGQVFLARIDMYFLLAIPAAIFLYGQFQGDWRRRDWWFLLPVIVLAAHSLIHALWQSWPYFYNTFGFGLSILRQRPWLPAIVLVVGLSGFGLLLWSRDKGKLSLPAHRFPAATAVAALLLVLLSMYAYFLRPLDASPLNVWVNWFSDLETVVTDRYNLVRLGWYLTPIGVWLGIWGAALMLARADRVTSPVLFTGLFFSLLYLWRVLNNPIHVYVMRRYVPAVTPFLTIGAVIALAWLWGRSGKWRWSGPALAAVWLAALLFGARGLVRQVDNQGLLAQFEQLDHTLPPDALLIFHDGVLIGLGDFVGTPLHYIYERPSFAIRDASLLADTAVSGQVLDTIAGWQGAHTVYWVGDPAWLDSAGLGYQSQEIVLEGRQLAGTSDHRPDEILTHRWVLQLSKVDTISP